MCTDDEFCKKTAYGDGHCAFAGAGDLHVSFQTGTTDLKQGGLFFVNASTGSFQKLALAGDVGVATPQLLVLHGIYFSQTTRRIYAVNHDQKAGE